MRTIDFLRSNPISRVVDNWSLLAAALILPLEIPDEQATDELAREVRYAAIDYKIGGTLKAAVRKIMQQTRKSNGSDRSTLQM
jgi:hypothetical protein